MRNACEDIILRAVNFDLINKALLGAQETEHAQSEGWATVLIAAFYIWKSMHNIYSGRRRGAVQNRFRL